MRGFGFFFFNDTATTEIYTLSLHDALPIFNPAPVWGGVTIVIGLLAALGNWGVARLLRNPGRNNPAIRLAYIHNLGDIQVSLAPALSGLLVIATGYSFLIPLSLALSHCGSWSRRFDK